MSKEHPSMPNGEVLRFVGTDGKIRPDEFVSQIVGILKTSYLQGYLEGSYIYRITMRAPTRSATLLKLDNVRKKIPPGDFADIVAGTFYHHALYRLPLAVSFVILKEYARVATQFEVVVRPVAGQPVTQKQVLLA